MMKILAFTLAAFFQIALSQQQQFGMTAAQMWDPNTWATPYYAAASQAWTNYLKNAQDVSNQLYKQWDMTDAANLFNAGMSFAQQAASQAQKGAQAAMSQGAQAAQAAAYQAQKGAQAAMSQGAQAAQAASYQAQQGAQAAAYQAQQAAQLAQKGAQTAAAQAQQFLP